MINTIQYTGDRLIKTPDGSDVKVPIPPNYILQCQGPIIQVSITHPKKIAEILTAQNKEIKSIKVNALIDTGASSCIVTKKVVELINLIQTGSRAVTSVQDEQVRPEYSALILLPWGKGKEVPVIECPLKGYDCIIGRDIMIHWNIIYNGVSGFITICD